MHGVANRPKRYRRDDERFYLVDHRASRSGSHRIRSKTAMSRSIRDVRLWTGRCAPATDWDRHIGDRSPQVAAFLERAGDIRSSVAVSPCICATARQQILVRAQPSAAGTLRPSASRTNCLGHVAGNAHWRRCFISVFMSDVISRVDHHRSITAAPSPPESDNAFNSQRAA